VVCSGVERTAQAIGPPSDLDGDTNETDDDHDDLSFYEGLTLLNGGIGCHSEDANRENHTVEQSRKDETGERPFIRAEAVRDERGTTKWETCKAHAINSRAKWIGEGNATFCCLYFWMGQVSDTDHG
jgi:hypothetical protein